MKRLWTRIRQLVAPLGRWINMFVGIALICASAVGGVIGTAMLTDAFQGWWKAKPEAPNSLPAPAPQAAPAPPPKPQTAAEKREQVRRAFVEFRRPLQEAVLDAEGELVVHQFDEDGQGAVEIPNGNVNVTVPISKNNGLEVWTYDTDPSIRRLLQIGAAEQHELIDVTDLPPIQRSISLPIGNSVVVEAVDGTIIQLLLVDAHVKVNGDQVDDASFRYRVYPAGTTQIRALRNGG